MKPIKQPRSSINWGKGISISLALLVLTVLLPLRLAAAPWHAQPVLLEMASAQPDAVVGVIVQKSVSDHSLEDWVARAGGTVTLDLHIINAFAAEIAAKHVPGLAQVAGVRYVSLDAPAVKSGGPDAAVATKSLLNAYDAAIGADKLWAEGYQGSSLAVAVVDSGIAPNADLNVTVDTKSGSRVIANAPGGNGDGYGHGTHIAGIIGGNGSNSKGAYVGIAPKVRLVSVGVTNSEGAAKTSDVVSGLQWVNDHRTQYNVRVVNISLNSATDQSYHTSPLDAACEILWFNKIVVVASSGNRGAGKVFPPGNDPFVITAGAVDDGGTPNTGDDVLASYSGYGPTFDKVAKPDLVAPGNHIISLLAKKNQVLDKQHPGNIVADQYFVMSGTSMSAGMVSGAVALLIQSNPNLNPDQIKYRLMSTARPFKGGAGAGAGYLDIYAAVHSSSTAAANTGQTSSKLLWTGTKRPTWSSVGWGSVDWGSVDWGSVDWGSVDWGSVDWGSDYWGK